MPLSEFQLIHRFFERAAHSEHVALGPGDDAALVRVPAGCELAVAIDTLVAGVHFPADTTAADVGYKSLAVNLSDLAAMGAEPAWATLALTLPGADEEWVREFAAGFFALADAAGLALIGGDMTQGPLTVSVQVAGHVPAGQALRRSGARNGDQVWVTGTVGDAALALAHLAGGVVVPAASLDSVLARLNRPQPRLREGAALRGIATAAIDLSDGLGADLGHVLEASGVGATIHAERLPLSAALRGQLAAGGAWNFALGGGDDYELCFTAPPEHQSAITQRFDELGTRCTCIGRIEDAAGLRCVMPDGETIDPRTLGYDHFAARES